MVTSVALARMPESPFIIVDQGLRATPKHRNLLPNGTPSVLCAQGSMSGRSRWVRGLGADLVQPSAPS